MEKSQPEQQQDNPPQPGGETKEEECHDPQQQAGGDEEVPILLEEEQKLQQKEKPLRRFRLTAPTNLPPGYTVDIITNRGEELTVRVTDENGGAWKGAVFVAEEVPARSKKSKKRVEGKWRDGLIACGNEGPIMCQIFTPVLCCLNCSPAVNACILQKLNLNCLGCEAVPRWIKEWNVVFFLLLAMIQGWSFYYWVTTKEEEWDDYYYNSYEDEPKPFFLSKHMWLIVSFVTWMFMVIILARTRTIVRDRYYIPGTRCRDFVTSMFCCFCSVLQMYRHMRASGDRPPETCCNGDQRTKRVDAVETLL